MSHVLTACMVRALAFGQPSPELRRSARRRTLKLNERGYRVGESNPAAILTDRDVELMLELREEGKTYDWLSAKFEVSWWTVQGICSGRRRNQTVMKVRAAPC